MIFNMPAETRELNEAVPPQETLPDGTLQGKNDFDKIGYGGPSPPRGKPHRYFFRLFVLDKQLDLKTGATRDQLVAAMKGHVIAEGQLLGTYGR